MDLNEIILKHGKHGSREEGMCVMEAVAYVAGEPHSDHPKCASPTIASFLIGWNDNLPSDEERARLLRDLIPQIVGTKGTREHEKIRAWMALDWLVRVHAPAWMDLVPALAEDAAKLRALPELVPGRAHPNVTAAVNGARERAYAAGDAAWDAARDAARAAAWDAAWDAAGDAAWDAARAAAGAAAWAAAGAAAWAAAGAAARDAARDAARARLAPVVARLQDSARDLVLRMIAVHRVAP